MRILFLNKKLQQLCESAKEQQKQLGADCARKLRARLADLDAAARVSELVAGRPHPLVGDLVGAFALDLHAGMRLVFEPEQQPPPRSAAGGIDWHAVTSVRITFIGDYHD